LHIKKVSLKKLRRPKVKALLQEKEEEIALLIT
jgi:hypothetical protein